MRTGHKTCWPDLCVGCCLRYGHHLVAMLLCNKPWKVCEGQNEFSKIQRNSEEKTATVCQTTVTWDKMYFLAKHRPEIYEAEAAHNGKQC